MSGHEENRFTEEDRERMVRRLAEVVAGWGRGYQPSPSDTLTLERSAAHSIGCTSDDLRGCELAEIADLVAAYVGRTQRAEGRPVLHCTCETGTCSRTGHVPQPAQCGHPGIFGHAGRLSHCHRDACRDAAQIAAGIIGLTCSAVER